MSSVIDRTLEALTLDQVVSNLNRISADLDAAAAAKREPEPKTLWLVRHLRQEYRRRTGEII